MQRRFISKNTLIEEKMGIPKVYVHCVTDINLNCFYKIQNKKLLTVFHEMQKPIYMIRAIHNKVKW